MPNPLRNLHLNRVFSRRNITWGLIVTLALALLFGCATGYYYFITPADTIIVTTSDFPAGLSANLTPDSLIDHVMAHLQGMIKVAGSNVVNDIARQEGLGPRSVKQTFIPLRAFSSIPDPLFNLQWRGIDLNLCRRIGMSRKAKAFLELGVIGLPDKGWRLTALLKEGSNVQPYGSAPRLGGACADFEKCADDLAKQILGLMDVQRLLSYDIKMNTDDANREILELYKTIPAASLDAEDLVAWGNAYYGLRRFDEALQKFQEALSKDQNSCPAHVARGFVYFSRNHGDTQLLPDLRYAEKDFRSGISCNPKNEFTLNSLCNTLLREWVNSPKPKRDPRLLAEAKERCDQALAINPKFVIAAVNNGYILYRQDKHKEALHQLESLSQEYPTDSNLFLNYGFLLYLEYLTDRKQETLRQATTQTRKSWELDQNSHAALNNLGFFYYEDGNYIQAVEYWKKANTAMDDPDSLAGLAMGLYKQGYKDDAITHLSHAIQIESRFRDPNYVQEHRNWSPKAASDLAKLVKLLPVPPD